MKASNKMLKLMVLPQAKTRGHVWNMLDFLRLCWSQYCKFLMLTFFVKKKKKI